MQNQTWDHTRTWTYGVTISRLEDDYIYQRPFGGNQKIGGEQAASTEATANRTKHALLHTLYQQNF